MLGIDSVNTAVARSLTNQGLSSSAASRAESPRTSVQQGERVVTVLEKQSVADVFPQSKISDEQLEEAVDQANYEMKRLDTNLRFSIHEKTRQVLVKIVDSTTNEVIREIPPEKLLDMCAFMMEKAGLLVDRRG